MRKEVTLGMAIGGALLVVGVVSVSLSHKNNNKKTNGQVTLLQPTDTSGAGEAAQPSEESKDTKPEAKAEDSKQAKPSDSKAKGPDNTQANADPKKNDAIDRLLFGGGQTPLISRTPDPKAENTTTTTTTSDAKDQTPPAGPTVAEPAKTTQTTEQPASPSTQPAGARKHTVQKGETFSTIAAAAYGSANYYPHIMRANPNIEANRLKPGMIINLPAVSDVVPSEKAADVRTEAVTVAKKTVAAATIDPTKEYKVVSGDSLHKIATNLYGKVGMVDKIYELNKSTIGSNPAALKVGMVLKLPEPPVNAAANAR